MADHDFFFALELSDGMLVDDLLTDVLQAVFTHVSLAPHVAGELTGVVRGVIAEGEADGHHRCDVRFEARGGQLEVAVSFAGAAPWRTTRPLP